MRTCTVDVVALPPDFGTNQLIVTAHHILTVPFYPFLGYLPLQKNKLRQI
jgi:hypothetical protein